MASPDVSEGHPAAFEWAVEGSALAGQAMSGDAAAVEEVPAGHLIAVVDGLGHGEEAAAATTLAIDVVRSNRAEPLDNLLVLCHQAMHATRGAAMTLARVDVVESSLTWVGVGNVDGFLVRNTPTGTAPVAGPVLSGGIVGFDLPPVTLRTEELRAGDLIVFATDGIAPAFANTLRLGMDVGALAEHIMESCAKGTDDALVLVTRFRGGNG